MTAKVSGNGQLILTALAVKPMTEDELASAVRLDPERVAASLAALKARGLVSRRFTDGEMRYVKV